MSRGSEALTNARKEEIIDAFEKLFQIKSVRSISMREIEEETDELIVTPVSTTATADFCGVMALAYEFYSEFDTDFENKCLAAGEKASLDVICIFPSFTVIEAASMPVKGIIKHELLFIMALKFYHHFFCMVCKVFYTNISHRFKKFYPFLYDDIQSRIFQYSVLIYHCRHSNRTTWQYIPDHRCFFL